MELKIPLKEYYLKPLAHNLLSCQAGQNERAKGWQGIH